MLREIYFLNCSHLFVFLFLKNDVYLIYNSLFKFIVSTGQLYPKNPVFYAWIFAKREFYLLGTSWHFFFWTLAPTSSLVFNKQSPTQLFFSYQTHVPLLSYIEIIISLKFYRIYILYHLFDLNRILFNSYEVNNREH